MAKKEDLVVGIDIGSHAIKICHIQKTGKGYKLLSLGSATIPSGAVEDGILHEPEAVGEVLAKLLKNLKITQKKVGISISGYSVIVKKINLEAMEDKALAEYINAEAEQYIPFDVSDVYLDFQKLPSQKAGTDRSEVMLVAAKKEVVDEYLDLLTQLKLMPVLVDVDGFALENIWEAIIEYKTNVALVDIGASKMNINIISNGVSVLARDVKAGSDHLTNRIAVDLNMDYEEAEKIKLGSLDASVHREKLEGIFLKICTPWVAEIKKAIDLYKTNNPGNPIQQIILSGGGSKVRGLVEFIIEETGLESILFDPFRTMNIDEKKIDRQFLNAVAPQMAIAAGIAIRPSIL